MKTPVKYYKHATTIEDADSKIIVDCAELSEEDSKFIETAINSRAKAIGSQEGLRDLLDELIVKLTPENKMLFINYWHQE